MKPIIFSGLEYCLNDKRASCELAHDALYEIGARSIPLVISSSKSLKELIDLVQEFPVTPYLIGENGASFAVPMDSKLNKHFSWNQTKGAYNVSFNPDSRSLIVNVLEEARTRIGDCFIEFSKVNSNHSSRLADLNYIDLKRALNRDANEVLIWQGNDYQWWQFVNFIEEKSLRVQSSEFFIHVMDTKLTKKTAMFDLLTLFQKTFPEIPWYSVGFGSLEEDILMLEHFDYPVVVRRPKLKELRLEREDYQLTHSFTSERWNESLFQFLNLNLQKL